VIFEHAVEAGDLFRMCQTKDVAVRDWVKLAVTRATLTGSPAVFWLNEARAHDAQLIKKVNVYLKDHDTAGLDLSIKAPVDATKHALHRPVPHPGAGHQRQDAQHRAPAGRWRAV